MFGPILLDHPPRASLIAHVAKLHELQILTFNSLVMSCSDVTVI